MEIRENFQNVGDENFWRNIRNANIYKETFK